MKYDKLISKYTTCVHDSLSIYILFILKNIIVVAKPP